MPLISSKAVIITRPQRLHPLPRYGFRPHSRQSVRNARARSTIGANIQFRPSVVASVAFDLGTLLDGIRIPGGRFPQRNGENGFKSMEHVVSK